METSMARSPHDGDRSPASLDRRGFKVLSLAGGSAIAVLLVVLGTPQRDGEAEPWIESAPAAVPAAAAAQAAAAQDAGVEWQQAEVWTEFGPAAVAAYER
jgi:hypothetical protein